MSMMNLDLARLLVAERLDEAAQRQRRADALRSRPRPTEVPRQRRTVGLFTWFTRSGGLSSTSP